MKILISTCFILVLTFVGTTYIYAQEPEATTTQEDVIGGDILDIEIDGDVVVEKNIDTDEEFSEEEIEEILAGSEILDEKNIDSLEDIEGEVIAVTDDEVIVENEDHKLVVINAAAYEEQVSKGGGGGRRKAEVGEKVETGTINTNGTSPTITTKSGTYIIPNSVYITRNGDITSLDGVRDGDKVTAVLDKDGNLIVLELVGEIEKISNTILVGSIATIVIILLLALALRKREVIVQ